MFKNEKAVFRHRGFFCASCEHFIMVFGTIDPDPHACQCCGGPLELSWDHLVTQHTTVEPFSNAGGPLGPSVCEMK